MVMLIKAVYPINEINNYRCTSWKSMLYWENCCNYWRCPAKYYPFL